MSRPEFTTWTADANELPKRTIAPGWKLLPEMVANVPPPDGPADGEIPPMVGAVVDVDMVSENWAVETANFASST